MALSMIYSPLLLLLVSCSRRVVSKTTGPTPAPLVPTSTLPTYVKSVVLKGESHTERLELLNPVNLTLECTWAGNQNKEPNITGWWLKDGNDVPNSRVPVELQNEQYNLRGVFSVNNDTTLGNYSCVFANEARIDFLLEAPQIGDVREKPIVSYIGDSTVITCKMDDTKPMPITWNWFRDNGTEKEQIIAESSRFEIKNDERKTRLVVHDLTEEDSGLYYCGAVFAISTPMSHVKLKVITIMEPLKPFLAILVEVVVLVAAILLYEKTQSKKKATAENVPSADQNNTVTQEEPNGPEGSPSTRQRKV
ncbi:embigin [Gouania willdenowi]|uniref:Ig-like domain-containing protein n=1 Tax=Gouania willdenowi TaxID=441366 RepID=A0A8C5HSA3_GOUWI|nr:embigin [Gouania willdenowi]